MLAPLRDAFRTARESLSDAAHITPGWLLLCSTLVLVQAVLPGAQVVLLENLIDGLSAGLSPWRPLLGLTVVVGLMYPLGQVAVAAGQRMMLRLRLHYRTELAQAAARLSPLTPLADQASHHDVSQRATCLDRLGTPPQPHRSRLRPVLRYAAP